MAEQLPATFYHSISRTRLKDAAQLPNLPGKSRFHLDAEGKRPGVWLTDQIAFAVEGGYGKEESDEVIETWDAEFMKKITGREDAKALEIKQTIAPIILEIGGLGQEQIMPHPLLLDQYFYTGDIEWGKVKKFLVRDNNPEALVNVKEIAEQIRRDKNVVIGVETYNWNAVQAEIESRRPKFEKLQNDLKETPRTNGINEGNSKLR